MVARIQMIKRTEALSKFQLFLQQTKAWVLVVTGLDGIGKSQFLEQIGEQIRTHSITDIALPLTIDFANDVSRQDPFSILEAISQYTNQYCNYDKVENFRQSLLEMRKAILVASTGARIINQYIIASNRSKVIKSSMEAIQSKLENIIEEKEKVIIHAYGIVRDALREQLSTFGGSIPSYNTSGSLGKRQRLLICLDGCQQLSQADLKQVDSLIKNIHTDLSQLPSPIECLVVIASRVKPSLEVIKREEQQHIELVGFTQPDTERYLQSSRIAPELFPSGGLELFQRYIHDQVTYGHPLCLSLAVEACQRMAQEHLLYNRTVFEKRYVQSAWDELIRERVTRSLKPCYAEAIYKGAFAEYFTEDSLRRVLRTHNGIKAILRRILRTHNRIDEFKYYEFTRLPSIVYYRNNVAYHTVHQSLRYIITKYAEIYDPEECRHSQRYQRDFALLCKRRTPCFTLP